MLTVLFSGVGVRMGFVLLYGLFALTWGSLCHEVYAGVDALTFRFW